MFHLEWKMPGILQQSGYPNQNGKSPFASDNRTTKHKLLPPFRKQHRCVSGYATFKDPSSECNRRGCLESTYVSRATSAGFLSSRNTMNVQWRK